MSLALTVIGVPPSQVQWPLGAGLASAPVVSCAGGAPAGAGLALACRRHPPAAARDANLSGLRRKRPTLDPVRGRGLRGLNRACRLGAAVG